MTTLKEYIESGILESYVLGNTSAGEAAEVEIMAAAYDEVRREIWLIRQALEKYAALHAAEPSIIVKAMLLATIDYAERKKKGEIFNMPPPLHEGSVVEDYSEWLNAKDAVVPVDFSNLHARIIGRNRERVMSILWIKEYAPPEVHTRELEKFLIVEGACDFIMGQEVYHLVAGDTFSIPLHAIHEVKITSDIPCKAILQRSAA